MSDDYFEPEDRACCSEACIVVYVGNTTAAHCYRGTQKVWEKLVADTDYFSDCNACYMIVGATADE